MLRKLSFGCSLSVIALLALSLSSCKSAKKSDETEVPGGVDSSTMPTTDENTLGDSDSGRAMGLQTVYFPYDSVDLDEAQKSTLKSNAEVLKANPTAKIQIEGHCDARGGIQYNLALGEKRANTVKNYLRGQGVGADRITTISYGKERVMDAGMSEEAHAKNRRANFVVTSR